MVFMAEQTQPVRRKVALKVLKPGMDTRQVVARFEAERQALALMDHPNIARVFDGGETAAGRPYFVMELVRGVPITDFCDTNHMPIGLGPLQDPVGTNMGNPHATFFVDDVAAVPLDELGPKLEHDRFFSERANIGVAELMGEGRLRLRVWERGAGLTLACGSGACAAVVAASRRGLVKRKADVVVDGGMLSIEWLRDDHVLMTGGVALAFKGELDRSLLG